MKKFISSLTACAMLANGFISSVPQKAKAVSSSSRVRVDINRSDGRKALYAKNAENWQFTGDSFTTSTGVTVKISNGSNSGSVDCTNNKKLQKYDGTTPCYTADGVFNKDNDSSGALKVELSGLSNGTHSFSGWHSALYGVTASTLKVSVNGKTVQTGIACPSNVQNDNEAGRSYVEFTGTSATILIQGEENQSYSNAWLNAFEIDGASPFDSISEVSPEDKSLHNNIENGLNWKAGKNAVSHDVYIGTDLNSVMNADKSSAEYKGTVTKPHFDLDSSYSSIPVYYWRVDEVSAGGTVKGAVYSFQLNRLAFPTAEGYGRFARGGRGGRIVEVTNLNDSGEGSLRQALEVEKGSRIVVFKVGGVIELKNTLCIPDDGGDVYVAGQTAPGDGITLINYDFGAMGAEDVIIRDIRVRVGDMNGSSHGGMGLSSCNNTIVDHCSVSWATDEGFSSRSASNITFQWNIIGESLNNSVHYDAKDRSKVERHAFAASISGNKGSFHHNLLINNTGRNWSLAGGMENDGVTYGGALDISNNVVYNWRDRTTDGGVRRLNFVNNYYKAGAVSNTGLHVVSTDGDELGTGDMQKMYVSGNIMTDTSGNQILKASDDAWAKGKAVSGGKNSTANDIKSTVPFFPNYINLDTAESAYSKVIDNTNGAGANVPKLDYIDSRYHKEVTSGTYTYKGSKDGLSGIIDSQNDVGGYPNNTNFKSGTAPADTDHDGMPDEWEKLHGLNPNNASDGSIVSLSADDYTNVELYLNELAGDNVEFNGTPAKSAFELTEAEDYDNESGTKNQSRDDGGSHVAYIESGDYIQFNSMDFGTGAKSFTANITGNLSQIEIYSDSLSGSPVAVLDFKGSGNWNNWQEVSCNIPEITGIHNIYLVFKGGSGYLVNIDNFVFGRNKVAENGRLVGSMKTADSITSDYSLSDGAEIGSPIFSDRTFTIVSLPDILKGSEQILTACNDKALTSDVLSFTASDDISVYIALDSRMPQTPDWLSSYQKTSLALTSSNDVVFSLYRKDFKKGEKAVIGGNGQSYNVVNYTVLVSESSSLQGDTNCDGTVNVYDLTAYRQYITGNRDLKGRYIANADMNGDGNCNADDMKLLSNFILGKK